MNRIEELERLSKYELNEIRKKLDLLKLSWMEKDEIIDIEFILKEQERDDMEERDEILDMENDEIYYNNRRQQLEIIEKNELFQIAKNLINSYFPSLEKGWIIFSILHMEAEYEDEGFYEDE